MTRDRIAWGRQSSISPSLGGDGSDSPSGGVLTCHTEAAIDFACREYRMYPDRGGRYSIHYDAAEGHHDELAHALAEGVDPSIPDKAGFTPLHFAAQSLDPVAVRLLIEAGAALEVRNRYGATPLMTAFLNARDDDHGVIGLFFCLTRVPTSMLRTSPASALGRRPTSSPTTTSRSTSRQTSSDADYGPDWSHPVAWGK